LTILLGVAAMLSLPALAGAATLETAFAPTVTGTAPWDLTAGAGNDTSPDDDVIRTNDRVTFSWAISVNNGPSPNTTITHTLPVGMTWTQPMPAFCLSTGTPASSISADDRTIVCNLGDLPSGSADQYAVTATVRGNVANGSVLSSNFTAASSDPATASSSPTAPVTLRVSAAPRVNLVKSAPNPTVTATVVYRNGIPGRQISYPVSLVVDSVDGKGTKGNELITTPIGFTDVITVTPTARLDFVDCGAHSGQVTGLPNGNGGGIRGTTFSGTPTCVQDANGNIRFTVPTTANLTGEHVPTQSASGAPLPANRSYLAAYYLRFWIPNADIVAAGGTVNIRNVYQHDATTAQGIRATSISGQVNTDPFTDNSQSLDVTAVALRPGTISVNKNYQQSGGGTVYQENQHVYPGSTVWGRLNVTKGGDEAIPGGTVTTCDMFDNTTHHLTLEGNTGPTNGTRPAWLTGATAGLAPNAVIEYGTGGVRGHDATAWTGTRADNCSDASSPAGWHQDPAALGVPLDQVTKIRVRYLADFPGGVSTYQLMMNFKVRDIGLGETAPLEAGTILANFARVSTNWNTARTWSTNNYDPATAGGIVGARLKLSRGEVRIAKDTDPAGVTTALTGETISYRLTVTATGAEHLATGIMRTVTVRDTLDRHLIYVDGTASVAPTQIVSNADGTTTLVWVLGDRAVNTAIPDITYDATVGLDTPNNHSALNRAIVSSPDDASADALRTDQHEVLVSRRSGILVTKVTSTPWIEPQDRLGYTITYINNSPQALTSIDSIDVLPWNGDGRGSNFNGTVSLTSVTPGQGQTVRYTARTPAEISDNPRDASNAAGGTTRWCLESEFGDVAGCPASIAEATAVRVSIPGTVPEGVSYGYDLTLTTAGGRDGDVYVNRAGLATPDPSVLLTAYSELVETEVVTSTLGDRFWIDSNRNGVQDEGEPPVAGETVTLLGVDKHGEIVNRTARTGTDGRYSFANLVSGEYAIGFPLPADHAFTSHRVGDDTTRDSDVDPTTGTTGPITVASPIPNRVSQEDLTWDAGLVALPGSITIVKRTGSAVDQDFAFTTSGLGPDGFSLNTAVAGRDRTTFSDLDPGVYTVTEGRHEGWSLADVRCEGVTTTSRDGASVRIDLGPNRDVTCTFVNERVVTPATPVEPNPVPPPPVPPADPDPVPPTPVTPPAPPGDGTAAGTPPVTPPVRPPAPNVIVTVRTPPTTKPGQVITVQIRFRNTRPGSVAGNTLVCVTIPSGTTVLARGGGVFRNGKLCWRVPRLGHNPRFLTRGVRLRVNRNATRGTRIVTRASTGGRHARAITRVVAPPRISRPVPVTG